MPGYLTLSNTSLQGCVVWGYTRKGGDSWVAYQAIQNVCRTYWYGPAGYRTLFRTIRYGLEGYFDTKLLEYSDTYPIFTWCTLQNISLKMCTVLYFETTRHAPDGQTTRYAKSALPDSGRTLTGLLKSRRWSQVQERGLFNSSPFVFRLSFENARALQRVGKRKHDI